MDETKRRAYLDALGVTVWLRRGVDAAAAPASDFKPATAAAEIAPAAAVAASASRVESDWSRLEAEVRGCTACELHIGRTQTVFGVGNRNAEWMVIGEAPGAEEDQQGEPFVGRAGKLLNEMLRAIGLSREQVYIANIVKCRPPNNREPQPQEAAACASYLRRQIDLVKPRIIVCVGRIAAVNLLGNHPNLGAYRSKVHRYADTGIPVVVTYHPAYLLRSPLEKRKAWEDLQFAVGVYRRSGAESA